VKSSKRTCGTAAGTRPKRANLPAAVLITSAWCVSTLAVAAPSASAAANARPSAKVALCSLVPSSAISKIIGSAVLPASSQSQSITMDSRRNVSAVQTSCLYSFAHSNAYVGIVYETMSKALPLGVLEQDLKASAESNLPSGEKYSLGTYSGLSVPAFIVKESGPKLTQSGIIAVKGDKICGPVVSWLAPAHILASLAKLAVAKFM